MQNLTKHNCRARDNRRVAVFATGAGVVNYEVQQGAPL